MRISNFTLRLIAGIVLLLGFVILITSQYLYPSKPLQQLGDAPLLQRQERLSKPLHIRIATIIDLPTEVMPYGKDGWEVAPHAASIASTSAYPGESGNIIVYSHNRSALFGKLSQVKKDDRIEIKTADGKTYSYIVTSRSVVRPDQIEMLRPTQTEVLTLYTCSGLFDSKRLVVQAVPEHS